MENNNKKIYDGEGINSDKEYNICVVGLGYVGLPLAVKFGQTEIKTIGFDVNLNKIEELEKGFDSMGEVSREELSLTKVKYTSDATAIKSCNFVIVAVPTPVDDANNPDISLLQKASKTIGENLQKGTIVVYESTVYPGCTEDDCIPILEKYSGLKCGEDFHIGYSPERINPGDKERTIDKIVKVVSGDTALICSEIGRVYGKIVKAGIYEASSIKVAEAAKVIENTQRDINIALMNELAIIFDKMNIDTHEVLEAAGTKWNFLNFTPGLVGGHCIGVDPYYLVHKAKQLGVHPYMITAGRKINDGMSLFVANKIIKMLINQGKAVKGAKILLLGLTFKPNVNDIRNSKAYDLIKELEDFGCEVSAHDPFLDKNKVQREFGVQNFLFPEIENITSCFDGIILVTGHEKFKSIDISKLKTACSNNPIFYSIPKFFPQEEVSTKGFKFSSL